MTASITMELGDGASVLDLIRRFGPIVLDASEKGLRRGMQLAVNRAKEKTTSGPITARSTVLRGSITALVKRDRAGFPIASLGVKSGLADKYAAIQELGTKGAGGDLDPIVPRHAKALAIPIGEAKTKRGVPKYTGPRDEAIEGELFLVEREGKPPLLARKKPGRKEAIEPLFVLVKKVELKPRRYLRDSLIEKRAEIANVVASAVGEAIGMRGTA